MFGTHASHPDTSNTSVWTCTTCPLVFGASPNTRHLEHAVWACSTCLVLFFPPLPIAEHERHAVAACLSCLVPSPLIPTRNTCPSGRVFVFGASPDTRPVDHARLGVVYGSGVSFTVTNCRTPETRRNRRVFGVRRPPHPFRRPADETRRMPHHTTLETERTRSVSRVVVSLFSATPTHHTLPSHIST